MILGVIDARLARGRDARGRGQRIGRALPHKPVEQLVAAPDCGMKYLPRDAAYAKLESLVAGAKAGSGASAVRSQAGQSSREASSAPSCSAASFAHTTSGSTAAWPTQVP